MGPGSSGGPEQERVRVRASGSARREPPELTGGLAPTGHHGVDPTWPTHGARTGAALQPIEQLPAVALLALRDDLDIAVHQVLGVAHEIGVLRHRHGRPPEPDTLHVPVHRRREPDLAGRIAAHAPSVACAAASDMSDRNGSTGW